MPRRKLISLAVSLLAVAGLTGVFFFRPSANQTVYHAAETMPTVTITINATKVLAEVASTPKQQMSGLSNRSSLPVGNGMLFPFDPPTQPSFWMHGMRFPLDFIWIRNGRIVQIDRNVPVPAASTATTDLPIYSSQTAVDNVLEVNANAAEKFQVGNSVTISESDDI